jgi:RNA polymerase sigma-70 factor, ECF subfamily
MKPTSTENDVVTNESPIEMSDELLVSAAKSGDANAFVELSRRHSTKLLHRTYRITRNWQDAEDVVQESFLKAFVHVKDFEGRSSFASWLTPITINSALMILRKKRCRPEVSIEGNDDDHEAREKWTPRDLRPNPETRCVQREREQLLEQSILSLPALFREVVQLRQTQEYSVREVAEALGVSVPAVKSRLSRAKTALRMSLSENGWNRKPLGEGEWPGTERQLSLARGRSKSRGKGSRRRSLTLAPSKVEEV